MESAACGITAGINAVTDGFVLPEFTMIGALINYITDESVPDFQPMGANMGILPPLGEEIRDKAMRYQAMADRSLTYINSLSV